VPVRAIAGDEHNLTAPGDWGHIPDSLRPVYNVINQQLIQLKQTTPVRAFSYGPLTNYI
jgi:hypothetical protein